MEPFIALCCTFFPLSGKRRGNLCLWSMAVLLVSLLTPAAFGEETPAARLQRLAAEAQQLYAAGRYQEAVPPARELLVLTEQTAGPDHPLVA